MSSTIHVEFRNLKNKKKESMFLAKLTRAMNELSKKSRNVGVLIGSGQEEKRAAPHVGTSPCGQPAAERQET